VISFVGRPDGDVLQSAEKSKTKPELDGQAYCFLSQHSCTQPGWVEQGENDFICIDIEVVAGIAFCVQASSDQ
jgi:hypothetical protein